MKQSLLWLALAGLVATAVVVVLAYVRDMRAAYARIQGKSQLIASPHGDIEYTVGGQGPAVLVIHGSGGGFDQGELLARAVLGTGFRWITPSRFGYLRSTFHPTATFDEQAHAYAHLLDHLGIERVAVLALSHGGPSALLFAALHPERVSSMTLISAGVAAQPSASQSEANQKGRALTMIYQGDFRYWALTKMFRKRFLSLMGAPEAVIDALSVAQRALVDELIDGMNPVEPRGAGAAFDNRAKMPNDRISAIRAPTLILHARDDSLQLFFHAEFAASHLPHAQLVSFDVGGHLLLAVEQPTIRELVARHIVASERGARTGP